MDATELIEEAGRVAAQAAKQSALDLYYSPCTCSAPPRGHTTRQHDYRRLQVDELRAVLDVVERLAAALKASEERARKAEKTQEQLYDEWREELRVSERERDALAAANLAANKRIVELEHERDEERRKVDALLESSALLRDERDAARAELARLTTPRPIAEAPRDGTWILGCWPESNEWLPIVMHWTGKEWQREDPAERDEGYLPTHYLPMPEVKP